MGTDSCDVAVIGGGPGGATTSIFLRRLGLQPVVLEKDRFPRFHIGESLLPYNLELFDELGIHEEIRGRFMHKHGAEFVSACGKHRRKFYFRDAMDPGPPMAYQVLRSEFDELLLRRAREEGADVREQSTVTAANDRGTGWELEVTPATGAAYTLKARAVVDASGQSTFLASRLRLKQVDPEHRRWAVFGHFRGVERSPGEDAGNIMIVPFGAGHWFWFIPMLGDVTSVGMVVNREDVREHKDDLEGYLHERIRATPAIAERMARATVAIPVQTLHDFSYTASRFVGDRFLLVGDAAAFLDPVFSSGVLMAMSSGKSAAHTLERAFASGDLGESNLRSYETGQRDQIEKYFRLINAYYRPSFLEMFMNPTQRLKLQPAVTMLLAGKTRNRLDVSWRIELFYLIGKVLSLLPANRRHNDTCSHGCSVHLPTA